MDEGEQLCGTLRQQNPTAFAAFVKIGEARDLEAYQLSAVTRQRAERGLPPPPTQDSSLAGSRGTKPARGRFGRLGTAGAPPLHRRAITVETQMMRCVEVAHERL
jgi:hypothetical protein